MFFTDTAQLTASSKATEGEPDLYLCELRVVAGRLNCDLTDVSADENAGESADVQGTVLGESENATEIYYVANGRLGEAAVAGDCISIVRNPPPGAECNLYAYDSSTRTNRLIATLPNADGWDWEDETGSGNLGKLTSRVSPSGQYLAFMSEASLTGYDNVDARSGQRDEEVFVFDAGTDRLACASCNPTGARPFGMFDPPAYPGLVVDRPQTWGGRWIAGSIPGWTKEESVRALYQSRYLNNEGRLFFNGADALVPADTNGKEDVYEYEPSGVGSCHSGTSCVNLISSGTSSEESAFLDASSSGDDIFFLTAAGLVPEDKDGAMDIYDAHVCSSTVPCAAGQSASVPPCASNESCRSASAALPEGVATPASAAVAGIGNVSQIPPPPRAKPKPLTRAQKLTKALKACRTRRNRQKRAACEKQARKKYGPVKPKKKANPGSARSHSREGAK